MDDSFGPTPCKPLVGSSSDLGIKRLAQQKPELGQKWPGRSSYVAAFYGCWMAGLDMLQYIFLG